MALPLLSIPLIILIVLTIILIPFIIKTIKIILIIVAVIFIINILRKKFGSMKSLPNWEMAVIMVSLFAGLLTIGNHFGFLSVGRLPLAVQQPLVQASFSPVNLFLGFIIFVLSLMLLYKK